MHSSIHYIDLLSNPSFELIEHFSLEVNKESDLVEDDKGRWDIDRMKRYKFDEYLYTTIDGKIVNMTFNKWYGNFLRVGINSYTLSEYRGQVFRPLWKKGGYMDLTHKKHESNADGYFCTFYPKNSKIKSVIKMLQKKTPNRSFTFGGTSSGWLSKFHIHGDTPITFRFVPQYISYANNKGSETENYTALIAILENDKV